MFRMFNGEKKEQTSKALIKTNSVTPQTSVNNEEQITPLLRKDDQLDEIDISSSPKSQALVHQDNGLEALYDHFIKETNGDPIPFGRGSKIGLFLELLGGTGGVYAWPPAWEYAKQKAPWQAYSFAIANPISNALFLIKATDDLIDTIQAEANVPKEIAALLDSPTKRSLIAKYLKMGLGSLVCVVPFSIAVYLFPIPGCDTDWCLGLTVSHSTLSSTILHGVAWGIILTPDYWYYRLPILPLEKLYSLIKKSCTPKEKLELLRLTDLQQTIQAKYKNQLIGTFSKAVQAIINQRSQTEEAAVRTIQGEGASLIEFFELARLNMPALPPPPAHQSYFRRFISKTHSFLSNGGISVLGAGIMITGCIGWVANPIYIGFLEGFNLGESTALGGLPLYSTAVLCAFYGIGIFNQLYNYFTTWTGSARDKVSPEIRMYPKTFALYTLANLYVSFFAYASGVQLIRTVFADKMWDDIRPALEDIAMPTLQILSFIPLMDLFSLMIRKSQAKFGSLENDDTLAARLLVKMSLIIHYIQQMKGEVLMQSINRYTPEQQQALGIDPEQFKTDLEAFSKLKEQMTQLQIEHVPVDIETPRGTAGRNRFFSAQTSNTPLLVGKAPIYG